MNYRGYLDQPLEKLLAMHGDSRQVIDEATGLNKYWCTMNPRNDSTPFGSCTASSVSQIGYDAASRLLDRYRALSKNTDLAPVVSEHFSAIRSELNFLLCGHTQPDLEILLSPSGTDAELLALAIAHSFGRQQVTNILIGPTEVGSGTPAAASGQYFDTLTPAGNQVTKGEPIDAALADNTELVAISLRYEDGSPRDEKEIDSEVEEIVANRAKAGHQVLLHVIAHSKTGLHAPSLPAVRRMKEKYAEQVLVIVDAAQGRFSRRGLKRACDEGHLVMITGSKFYGGPPFSGGLVVPPTACPPKDHLLELPRGFSDFFAQDYFPTSWRHAVKNLPESGSTGLLLRWTAAIAEIRDYYATPSRLRFQVLRDFESAVPDMLGGSDAIVLDEISEPIIADDVERLLQSKKTVFPFYVKHADGTQMNYEELRKVWEWLNADLSATIGPSVSPATRRDLAPRLHIGQPVKLGVGENAPAVLRVALGGVLLSRIAQDPQWGETYEDREGFMADRLIALKRKIEMISELYPVLTHGGSIAKVG